MKNRVRELRMQKKISQLCLAMKVGCAQNTISKIELETTELGAPVLIKLSKYFNVSIDYILCNSELRRTQEMHNRAIKVEKRYSELFDIFEGLADRDKETVLALAKWLANEPKRDIKEG